jgi:hypothetical protein
MPESHDTPHSATGVTPAAMKHPPMFHGGHFIFHSTTIDPWMGSWMGSGLNGTNLRRIWDKIRHSGGVGWQERMDLENPGKPRLKATARGVDDKLTQPIGNACFFLKLAPFRTDPRDWPDPIQ